MIIIITGIIGISSMISFLISSTPVVDNSVIVDFTSTNVDSNIVNVITETIIEKPNVDYGSVLMKHNCISMDGNISDDTIISAFNHLKYHGTNELDEFILDGAKNNLSTEVFNNLKQQGYQN